MLFRSWVARGSGSAYSTSFSSALGTYMYAMGNYDGTLQFYNADGTTTGAPTAFSNTSVSEVFIVGYSLSGSVGVAARVIGSGPKFLSSGVGIAAAAGSNVFTVIGVGSSSATIYNSDGTTFGTVTNSVAITSVLIKWSGALMAQWSIRYVGSGFVTLPGGVSVDSSENVYVTGYTPGNLTLYNSDGTTYGSLSGDGSNNMTYVIKYNSAGFVQWASKLFGNPSGISTSVDTSGYMYNAGTFNVLTLTAYNSSGTAFSPTITQGTPYSSTYLVKYSA